MSLNETGVQTVAPETCEQQLLQEDNAGNGNGGSTSSNLSLHCWLQLLTRESIMEFQGDSSSVVVRVMIACVYSIVCALGLVGNSLALYLLLSRHRKKQSSINCFVMGLAITDLQFVLTLPFWAVDTALDFRWPFGRVMCKIISSVTTMNMYASVFFLTAMSVARYYSISSALKMHSRRAAAARAKWTSLGIWAVSLLATLPHAIYSTSAEVSDEELCLVRFPDSGSWNPQLLLGLYQLQKVLLGFLIPLFIITVCYLLLLRVILSRRIAGAAVPEVKQGRQNRRSKVTKSIAIVVLSFFLCWLPNQALTLWGVLIKFDLVPFSKAFYNTQAYTFPLTVCLAHTNSCLNPVLYCLVRREFRADLKELLLHATPSFRNLTHLLRRKAKVAEAPPVLVLVQMDV
ncbi:relaxin family peptide receptor 3.2b [Nothobranchius furzeri]|uniref:Relaxin family peptide receptor 3.2b n=1 Tax=Nothobranchius furzeri TaxID=105023 RepID=A0A1A8AWM7_NOTFU|nr:relaxin family peptide receptor 3.2b [Nothobranchius furzeri]KAF7203378.1 relaxin-3 receptor 1-like [Nothobranchius furzeri]